MEFNLHGIGNPRGDSKQMFYLASESWTKVTTFRGNEHAFWRQILAPVNAFDASAPLPVS